MNSLLANQVKKLCLVTLSLLYNNPLNEPYYIVMHRICILNCVNCFDVIVHVFTGCVYVLFLFHCV